MTDPQLLAAAALLDVRGRPDLADAVMAYRRPAPTVEAAECCTRSSCCHATRDEHGTLMGHDAPLPPGAAKIGLED